MVPVVRISQETWERLKRWAVPLEDKPEDALRRVLDIADQHGMNKVEHRTQPVNSTQPERSTRNRRIVRGRKLPQGEYHTPILESLYELRGRGTLRDVLHRVENKVKRRLTEYDYEPLHTGQIRWRNTAEWARNDLVKEGLLVNDSPRGIWKLSEEGLKAVGRETL